MTFSTRQIDVTFQLGSDASGNPQSFAGSGGADTAKLTGLRVSCQINKVGTPGFNKMVMRIWGMTLDQMNQLSTLGRPRPTYARNNTVIVEAGDPDSGVATAFIGTITDAYAEGSSTPDVPFVVAAQTGFVDKIKPVPPTTVQGSADVAQLMSGFAATMNATFENNGVSGIKIPNPYYPGTAMEQAARCAQAANIDWGLDDGGANRILWIAPKNTPRTKPAVTISPATGMIGYPAFTDNGIILSTIYNPNIVFQGTVTVSGSQFQTANATWLVYNLTHTLESEVYGGKWETEVYGTSFKGLTVAPIA